MIDRRRMAQQLTVHEGLRLKPYLDSVGKLTIGVGRNLDDKGISESEAGYLLKNDIEDAYQLCLRTVPTFRQLSDTRKMVLVDMMFNLGPDRLRGFKKFQAALAMADYEWAAREMLDSKWAEQVGVRALTLAEMMRTGEAKW